MSRLTPFLGVFPVIVALISSAPAARAEEDVERAYGSAFGTTMDGDLNATSSAVAVDEDAMAMLRQLGSFPVRVHLGVEEGGKGWPDSQWKSYAPKPVERRYKAGACEFVIKTGDFTLRKYEKSNAELVVSKDPIARFSTLKAGNRQPVLVSVNTELYVSVTKEKKAVCKKLFGARRVRLGIVDLARTDLSARGEEGSEALGETVRGSGETMVYLAWDAASDSLALQDATGLAPAVESAVFHVRPEVEGDYYLAVTPKLGLQRAIRGTR